MCKFPGKSLHLKVTVSQQWKKENGRKMKCGSTEKNIHIVYNIVLKTGK